MSKNVEIRKDTKDLIKIVSYTKLVKILDKWTKKYPKDMKILSN